MVVDGAVRRALPWRPALIPDVRNRTLESSARVIGCVEYEDEETATLVQDFMSYVISEEGQQTSADNAGSAPLPSTVADEAQSLIDGIEVAMMTTRRPDGHLVSRAMQTQERRGDADLWFVTDVEAHKLEKYLHLFGVGDSPTRLRA